MFFGYQKYCVDCDADAEPEEPIGNELRSLFSRDLPYLMYGFGDAERPKQETVDLMSDIAVEYVTDIVHAAMAAVSSRGNTGGKKADELKVSDTM